MIHLPKGSGLAFALVLVVILAIAAAAGIGWWEGKQSAREAQHQAFVDWVLSTRKQHHKWNDDLRAANQKLATMGREQLAQDAKLRRFTDSVRASLDSLPVDSAVVPIRIVRRLVEVYETRLGNAHQAIMFLDSALILETERADSNEQRVQHLEWILSHKPQTCRIVFVKCPSRTAVAVASGVIGFLVGLKVATDD